MVQPEMDFDALRVQIASPDQVRDWSYGEVTKPETLNYKTFLPEEGGLFCDRIFGPEKPWQCRCGKYGDRKKSGIICDVCGVEVADSKVRRRRMGHIELAMPVAHTWFSKSSPSYIGTLLNIATSDLNAVIYYRHYLVYGIDTDLISDFQANIDSDCDRDISALRSQYEKDLEQIHQEHEQLLGATDSPSWLDQQMDTLERRLSEEIAMVNERREKSHSLITTFEIGELISVHRFGEIESLLPGAIKVGMGAEILLHLLENLDIATLVSALRSEMKETYGPDLKRIVKRLHIAEMFQKSDVRPEWMILQALPVMPPDLRPMVPLSGGNYAASDLNEHYRRVIHRNNRLKKLKEMEAPVAILVNEKRMLQEAVDNLINNGKGNRALLGPNGIKLKSLSDLIKGKSGRFRQNLLGKRVDYSGRSMIAGGPELKMHECGLPRKMALELFKPYVINRLYMLGYSLAEAKHMIEREESLVWECLEKVAADRPVMLNRAPTLHRLSVQAFIPVLIDGYAIRLHPLVTSAFNADYDGDQMAVHLPISKEAIWECRSRMLSIYNLLNPSNGEPIVSPSLDIVLGCFYMTQALKGAKGEGLYFPTKEDAEVAYKNESIDLQALIWVRDHSFSDGWMETTAGRIIFNGYLPDGLDFYNSVVDKKVLKKIAMDSYKELGFEAAAVALDGVKEAGFQFASLSGISVGICDVEVPSQKGQIIAEANEKVLAIKEMYLDGLMTDGERYDHIITTWNEATDRITKAVEQNMSEFGGIKGDDTPKSNKGIGLYMMSTSGAKGNVTQIRQMAGMRGLMADTHGRPIEIPIKTSFREGMSSLDYFISSHGARKARSDTALRTADSGYMTRRLIDVASDLIIFEEDCGSEDGIVLEVTREDNTLPSFEERAASRFIAKDAIHPKTGEVLAQRNRLLDEETINLIRKSGLTSITARSPLGCESARGLCKKCYGLSLATWKEVMLGEAVGLIAAQSIGEPGTQLTMRTFHTGGVAGGDITSGLPRVAELFEARKPQGESILSEIDGTVEIFRSQESRFVRVYSEKNMESVEILFTGCFLIAEDGDYVEAGDPVMSYQDGSLFYAPYDGRLSVDDQGYVRVSAQIVEEREYDIPAVAILAVQTGDDIRAGDAITLGAKNPQDLLEMQGWESAQQYIIDEVQKVYRGEGVEIHDKHVETIVKRMIGMVEIADGGDSAYLPGDRIKRSIYEDTNFELLMADEMPATARPVFTSITRAALEVDSFLSAASFQEAVRILSEAAIKGSVDNLSGIKENVILGRPIPARLDMSPEGLIALGHIEPDEWEQSEDSVDVAQSEEEEIESFLTELLSSD